jgi:Zn-dependent M28 family amino/carboxypeptidase
LGNKKLTCNNLAIKMICQIKTITFLTALLIAGCNSVPTKTEGEKKSTSLVSVPNFNADSAYHYTAAQVAFGPRVPNSQAHLKCADYLANKLKSLGADVIVQDAKLKAFDNKILNAKNIIGQFNPEKSNRILLFAHWDSRPFSDHDPDPAKRNLPVDGANDGASSVGVLLEVARHLQANPTNLGIDIIFFDAEDYGTPDHIKTDYVADSWCLGSQYWAQLPHKENYYARFGILLDMVGAPNATFYQEQFSIETAHPFVSKIWKAAEKNGYGQYFPFSQGGMITDDHVYVNKYRGIPCVDIIQFDPSSDSGFGKYWHTQADKMENVDKQTLKAVGQTILSVIYNEE